MKKSTQNLLALLLSAAMSLSMLACSPKPEDNFPFNSLTKELSGAKFSVYYLSDADPVFKGDLQFSERLDHWQFTDASDSQSKELGLPFLHSKGKLTAIDLSPCKEGNYTLIFTNPKELRAFRLIQASVDYGFNAPIHSYLFETTDRRSNRKEYFQFNRE